MEKNIIHNIYFLEYSDTYWGNSLASLINVYCDAKIQNLVDNSEYSQIYKNLFLLLRKLIKLPYKKKKLLQIDRLEILQAKEAKNKNELEKLLSHKDQYFEIKYAILENSHLSKKAFTIILDNAVERQNSIQILQNARFNCAFDKYPDITNKFFRNIFRKKDNNNKWSIFLAKCPYTPLDILDELSQSTNMSVLCNLAEN